MRDQASRFVRHAVEALAFVLAGCATPVPTWPPAGGVPVPVRWAGPPPEFARAQARALQEDWWRGFGDPTLVRLIEDADAANSDIRSAQANLRRARALRDLAAAALRPTLSATLSAQRADPGAGASQTLFKAGFDAAWEPDLFGQAGHTLAATDAEAKAAQAALDATRISIAGEVGAAYVQWRGTLARLAVARRNLQAQAETLQITRWRAQAGLVTLLEAEQARVAVEQTRALLPVLESSAAQTRHALAVLTGAPPAHLDTRLDPAAAGADALPAPPADLAIDIPARVLRQRPDVRASEEQLVAAAERVAAAEANRYPVVALRASAAWAALTLGAIGSAAPAAALAAAAVQPLYDGGSRAAQREAQRAAFDAAQEGYRAQVLLALREAEDALVLLDGSRRRLGALHEAAQAADTAALLAARRYESGIVDFQTVLDTQRSLLVVQESLAGAQADWVTDHIRLYKALGGGWRPERMGEANPP